MNRKLSSFFLCVLLFSSLLLPLVTGDNPGSSNDFTDLGVSELSLLNGNATLRASYLNNSANITRSPTRGVGVHFCGEECYQIPEINTNILEQSSDSPYSYDRLNLSFNSPTFIESLQLRSLYRELYQSQTVTEKADLYFYNGSTLISHQLIEASENADEKGEGIAQVTDINLTCTKILFSINKTHTYGNYSDYSVALVQTSDKLISFIDPPSGIDNLFTLNITIDGSGAVTKDPDYPSYFPGTLVNLTATPDSGWVFDHWEGNLAGNDTQPTLLMDSNKSITAVFTQIELPQNYTLTILHSGNGTTTPAAGLHSYTNGTLVFCSASADSGWVFDRWEGAVNSTDSTIPVVMDSNKTVTAVFTPEEFDKYLVTFTIIGNGSLNAPYQSGTFLVPQGEHTFTATPDSGWQFANWSGDIQSTDNPLNLTVNQELDIIVNFIENQTIYYTLNLSTDGHGSISNSPTGSSYPAGTEVTLTAQPNSGYKFNSWSGNATGSTNPLTIIMDANTTIHASFTSTGGGGGGGSGGGGGGGSNSDDDDNGDDDNTTSDDNTTTGDDNITTNNPPGVPDIEGPVEGYTNTTYTYNITSSDDDGDSLIYYISWGDGTTTTSLPQDPDAIYQIDHQWTEPDTYRVRLSVTDGNSTSAVRTLIITIVEPPVEEEDFNIFWYIVGGSTALLFIPLVGLLTRRRYFYD